VLPVIHRATGFPVDIVLGGPGLEELFASAAENVRIGRLQVPVPTGTHLVVMKVLAGRPKDIEDAVALLATQASRIDAEELDELTKALAAALAEDDILVHLREARRRAFRLPAGQKRAPRSRTRQRRGRR
jgi:predicted RNA-binding Zn ribbon-like protein